LAEKEEDRFTRFLRELLLAPETLEVFLRDVCKVGVAGALSSHRVETQVTVTGGRADLVISAPNLHLIFEAKVAASSLHGLQMLSYQQALHESDVGASGLKILFILAPAGSVAQLCKEASAQLADTDSPIEVRGLSWQDVAKSFEGLRQTLATSDLRTHLSTFHDLVSSRMGGADEPFGAEEVALLAAPLTGQAIKRVATVYAQVIDALKAAGIAVTNSSGQKWQGSTLRFERRWWWFGIWPEVWAKNGTSPLFLQLPGVAESRADSLGAHFLHGLGSGSALPLPLKSLEPPSAAGARIAQQILRVLRELPDTGGPRATMPSQDPSA
jgi:hypothetical protein